MREDYKAMRIKASTGDNPIARVYIGEFENGSLVEMVESVQPPLPRDKKWVLIVSTLFGCPVQCPMCDAGGHYRGRLSKQEILDQLDFLVKSRFPDGKIPVEKFKVQFARMGEPSLNPSVLEVLEELPQRYDAPGLIPCISTIAPSKANGFFEELLRIKRQTYSRGNFQMQFSIHTTNRELRDRLMPVNKWDLAQIARYCGKFWQPADRKITLNFALVRGMPVDSEELQKHFDPERFLIKLTPLNPTYAVARNDLISQMDSSWDEARCEIVKGLRGAAYEVIVSIGEMEENLIGSNCGQYLAEHLATGRRLIDSYSYDIRNYT
jgi:23S rRNA (adenine2503-C2)-methyltransferase